MKKNRKLSFLIDIRGWKNVVGEIFGWGLPPQPRLSKKRKSTVEENTALFNEEWFVKTIKGKVVNHPANSMEGTELAGEKIYDEPLVGFVKGNDPIFNKYKEIISSKHFSPEEILAWQAKLNGVKPPKAEDISVVSIIMPITKKTKEDTARQSRWTSERWAQTRLLGEIFSQIMVREIVSFLMSKGILAVSPDVTPIFKKISYPKVRWASPWSHRHIAYAAGLGTFGIHDYLITEKGAAHRCTSFVVNLKLNPNCKPHEDIHAHCLHYHGIKCLECAKRCPVGAISKDGHDKEKCYKRIVKSIFPINLKYHIFIYGCGLCSVGTPCESGIPIMH